MAVLAVVDHLDGTGATASISGAGSLDVHQLYYASFDGMMDAPHALTTSVTITGNASATLALPVGYYLWLARNTATDALLPICYQNISDASVEAKHYECLEAVRLRINSMNLAGLSSAKIIRRWVPNIYESTEIAPPVVVIAPIGAEDYLKTGVISQDDVGYPVIVAIVDAVNVDGDALEGQNRYLYWRQRIAQAFVNQRLPGVDRNFSCRIIPEAIVDPGAFRENYLVSILVFQFLSRMSRGLQT